jgi:hypothetical protein
MRVVALNSMKKLTIFLFLFQLCFLGCAQKQNWSSTHDWKIYALNNKEAYFYPVDTLGNFKSAELDDSTIISYLHSAKILPKQKVGVWMGVFIATYKTSDKNIHKVALSSYGGFLYDFSSKFYYEIQENSRQSWHTLINKNLGKVFEGKTQLE